MSLVALLTNFVTVYSIMYQLGTHRANEKESEGTIFTHNEATGRRMCAICMCVQTQTFEQYFWQSMEMHHFAFQLTGKRQWGKQYILYVFSPCAKMLLSYSNNVLFIAGKVSFIFKLHFYFKWFNDSRFYILHFGVVLACANTQPQSECYSWLSGCFYAGVL